MQNTTTQQNTNNSLLRLSMATILVLGSQSAFADSSDNFSGAMLKATTFNYLQHNALIDSILDSMTRKNFHSNYGKKTSVRELKESEESIRNRDYDYAAIDLYVANKVIKERLEIDKLEKKLESLNTQHNDLREKDTQASIEAEKDKQKEILIQKAKVLAEQKAKTALQSKIQAHERERQRLARLETDAKNKALAKLQAQEKEQIATKTKQRDSELSEQNALANKLQNQISQAKSHKTNLAKTLEQESSRINAEIRQLQKEYQADAQIKNLTPTQKTKQKERQRDIASLDSKLKTLTTNTKQESQNQDSIISNNEKELAKNSTKQKEIKSAYERDIANIKEQNKQDYQAQVSAIAKQYYLAPLDTKAELESLKNEHTQIEVTKAKNTEIKIPQATITAITTRLKALYQQPNQGKNPEITQTKNQIEQAQKKLKEKEEFFVAQAKKEQDKQKQKELDSVRLGLGEVSKLRLKGVDLDKKDWTNQQILDALDRIFIPYQGERNHQYFIVPYFAHHYLSKQSDVNGQQIGGGILAGIGRNLGPLAGRFGAYIGYEFGYLDSSLQRVLNTPALSNPSIEFTKLQAQNHRVVGGLTYFKPFATRGTNEWFLKAILRGGGLFATPSIQTDKKTTLDMMNAWNAGLDIRAGKKFYSVKRNSFFSPEFGVSYDMLQTMKLDSSKIGANIISSVGNLKEQIFHFPQARLQLHYHKALTNKFKFSTTIGGVYNILYNPTVSLPSDSSVISGKIDLPAVYGIADINAHWALGRNTELNLSYTGAYFSTAVSTAASLKITKWF